MNTLLSDELFQDRRFSFKTLIFTLNFVLILFGYQIFTATLSGILPYADVDNSSIYTTPYRAFSILLLLCSVFLGSTKNISPSAALNLFYIIVVLYTIRAFISLELMPHDIFSPLNFMYEGSTYFKLKCWMYVILGPLSAFSIYRTWKQIDYNLAINLSLILGAIAITSTIYGILKFGNVIIGIDAENRINAAGGMLNTISLGHLGVSLFLLACFKFFYSKNFIWKIISFGLAIFSIIVAFRAGSRSPIVALIFVSVVWISSYYKNILLGSVALMFLSILIYILRFFIIDCISIISPVLANRLENSIRFGDSSGRNYLMEDFIPAIWDNPLFGSHFDLYGYAHNMFVDSYVMYGIILGNILPFMTIITLVYSYTISRERGEFTIICVIFLQNFVFAMLSGCWGFHTALQSLILLVLLYKNNVDSSSNSLKHLDIPHRYSPSLRNR